MTLKTEGQAFAASQSGNRLVEVALQAPETHGNMKTSLYIYTLFKSTIRTLLESVCLSPLPTGRRIGCTAVWPTDRHRPINQAIRYSVLGEQQWANRHSKGEAER